MVKILVVDKQRSIRNTLREMLALEGNEVDVAENLETSLELQEKVNYDIIISDSAIFEQYISKYGNISSKYIVIVTSDTRSVDSAIRYVRSGAYDYIVKPIDMNYLLNLIKHISEELKKSSQKNQEILFRERKRTKGNNNKNNSYDFIIGNSPAIRHVKSLIDKVAPSDAKVLITGPNGAGKELVAQALHLKSNRHNAPFVEVNCAAIPTELIESELFGHEKGAFTSAIKQRKGKFEIANGGTLFLDEIGDMSLAAQSKVLRVLQENRLTRVGGDNDIEIDVRVLAATNKDLREEINKGTFREDLYHRLSVIVIYVPPLVQRLDDIPLLVNHFLNKISSEYGIEPKTIRNEAIKELQTLRWNGNIRELRNVIERLIILSGDEITHDDVRKYAIDVF